MKLHHLHAADGAKTDRTRVGRGRSGRRGKTAGRGTKGTGARKNVPTTMKQRRDFETPGTGSPRKKTASIAT